MQDHDTTENQVQSTGSEWAFKNPASEEVDKIIPAIRNIQASASIVRADQSGQLGNRVYKYAPLDAIWQAVGDFISENGIVIIGEVSSFPDNYIAVRTIAAHISGQYVSIEVKLFCGTKPQEYGSAITYGRRYGLCALLGIVVSGDDDDGRTAQDGTAKTKQATTPQQSPSKQSPLPQKADLAKQLRSMLWEASGHDKQKSLQLLCDMSYRIGARGPEHSERIETMDSEWITQTIEKLRAHGKAHQQGN